MRIGEAMNIIVTGGTGFIGRALCEAFSGRGHRVVVLTRRPVEARRLFRVPVTAVEWDPREGGAWEQSLEGADAVINLAGAPIAEERWTESRKHLLTYSRVVPTRLLVEAMSRRSSKPRLLVSASGIGYYGASDDRMLDERAVNGHGFLAGLSTAWESEAMRAEQLGIRVVLMRTGMVLERDGGALPRMLLPFRLFAGGPIMPGTQWVSWIHRHDLIEMYEWAIRTAEIVGPLNAVAPEPVRMKEFCDVLGKVLHRPSWIPVPKLALEVMLGELGTMLTTGQRVSSEKALASGFAFDYPTLEQALRSILTGTIDLRKAA
jgi:uncharacterized protein (TIGR01777 family)